MGLIDFAKLGLGILDKVIPDKQERERLKIQLLEQQQAGEFKHLESELRRFEKAHDTYQKDSGLQKIYAITFLAGYLLLIAAMIYVWFKMGSVNLSGEAIAFIHMVFGAMSAKVNSIVDFLFGSSLGSKQKTEVMSNGKKE